MELEDKILNMGQLSTIFCGSYITSARPKTDRNLKDRMGSLRVSSWRPTIQLDKSHVGLGCSDNTSHSPQS